MKRMMLRVAGLMVLFGALSVATARADSRFSVHVGIGAPVAVAPGPYGYAGTTARLRTLATSGSPATTSATGGWLAAGSRASVRRAALGSTRLSPL